MPKLFISYRREDSQDVTGRIYDRLVEYFSAANVFKDIDNIPLGLDFRTVLDKALGDSAAILVVIGPNWTSCTDAEGRKRLDSPTDFVRLEVQTALKLGRPMIPVLVSGARMPTPDELPADLDGLPYRNGLAVRPDPDFHQDMERLATALEPWVSRSTSASRPTVNRALSDLAREREVERIDREWAGERDQYLVTMMKGQTFSDGQVSGGYPVREVPSRIGSVFGGVMVTTFGFLFAVIGSSIGGAFAVTAGLLVALVGVGLCFRSYSKAVEYEEAEVAYRKRRADALAGRTAEDEAPGSGSPHRPGVLDFFEKMSAEDKAPGSGSPPV
jgi:hypothetical protein